MVAQHAEPLPVRKLLGDVSIGGCGLEAERMTAQVYEPFPRAIARMTEFIGEDSERIARIELRRVARLDVSERGQGVLARPDAPLGGSSTLPHTRQVRCSRLE
jgi:hypothetical protein